MATESIRERILQDVETSLAAITGTGEYHIALAEDGVDRGQLPPSNLDRLPALRVSEGEEEVIEGPTPYITRMLSVTVRGWISVPDESLDVPLPTLANRLMADIERAMLAGPTRGGLAQDTILVGSLIHDDDEKDVIGSVSVTFRVQYRTLRNNPAQ